MISAGVIGKRPHCHSTLIKSAITARTAAAPTAYAAERTMRNAPLRSDLLGARYGALPLPSGEHVGQGVR